MRARTPGLAGLLGAILLAMACFPAGALAGTVTHVFRAEENITYYEFTPETTGTLTVNLGWSRPDGSGAPVHPEAEVDFVIQGYDENTAEPYAWRVYSSLMIWPQNPWTGVVGLPAGKPAYVGVVPYVGDVPYHLWCDWKPSGGSATRVIDETGWAYASSGEAFVPSTAGDWISVLQTWPGTLNRLADPPVSNVWANWDDYVWSRDDAGLRIADNYLVEYVPPVVTRNLSIPNDVKGNWFTVAPEIWTAAARPNVWGNIAAHTYPKPGSLTSTDAPAWYTYGYTDTAISDANTKAGYAWGSISSASASQRNFSQDPTTTSTITYNFYGTSLTWVYTKGPRGCNASVKIDGTEVGPVSLYNATVQYKQSSTFGGLTNAAHQVVIKYLSVGTGGGTFTYHDAFVAKTDAADPTPISENSYDGNTIYTWGTINAAGASGGQFSQASPTTAALAFTFSGTSIQWVYTKGPRAAVAEVYIDGVKKPNVDLYNATVQFQQSTTFSGLAAGIHQILIKYGSVGAGGGTFTYHDAFVVGGVTYQN